MAKKNNVTKGFPQLNKRLETIKKNLESFSEGTTKALAEYGRDTAKEYLIMGIAMAGDEFTQKDGYALADCIQAEKVSRNTWQVVARANRAPEDAHNSQQWQLFFAEYGAGVYANPSMVSNAGALNTYNAYSRKTPWWLYKDNLGKWHKVYGSTAIRYMFHTRQAMRQHLSGVIGKVKTKILRDTTYSGDFYDE